MSKKTIYTIGPDNPNNENYAKLIECTRQMDFSRILGLISTETEIPLSEKLSTSNDMTENGSKNVIDEALLVTDANGIIQVPTCQKTTSQHIIDETLCVKDSCGNLRFAQAENGEDLKNPSK